MTKARQKRRQKPVGFALPAFVRHSPGMLERVERCIPAVMIASIVREMIEAHGCTQKEGAFFKSVLPHLVEAVNEPFADLPSAIADKALVAADQAALYAYDRNRDRDTPAALLMAMVYWLKRITDNGYFTLYEGSAFAAAYVALWADIEQGRTDIRFAEKYAEADRRADFLMLRIQRRLETSGLFLSAMVPVGELLYAVYDEQVAA